MSSSQCSLLHIHPKILGSPPLSLLFSLNHLLFFKIHHCFCSFTKNDHDLHKSRTSLLYTSDWVEGNFIGTSQQGPVTWVPKSNLETDATMIFDNSYHLCFRHIVHEAFQAPSLVMGVTKLCNQAYLW